MFTEVTKIIKNFKVESTQYFISCLCFIIKIFSIKWIFILSKSNRQYSPVNK